ncbi:MAG TPA: 3-dehydroquinate synthase family protein, partial [Acidimicrobiales bacterium]|nr:3-dehydroquinate synthase family protein [Acidimicrobiales bacterium]
IDAASGAYDVLVGAGVRHELAGVVSGVVPGARRAAVVTQPGIGVEVEPGRPALRVEVPDGEGAKSLAEVERLARAFAAAGLGRGDVVVAVGGGVVCDLAGFAAAAYHRGVAYLNVATTLLAQVDAAVGGKTGVNLPEGKNLVGAFWQPRAVLCDTEVLDSLPKQEWASGRGEMAKYALLEPTLRGTPAARATDMLDLPLEEQVARCVALKAEVVAADEREGGRRALLNYGHTLAHALEAAAFGAADAPRHGEAVAVGLVFAALLARRLERVGDEDVERHRRVVAGFDLRAELPAGADPEQLVALMGRDKKAAGDLTFVLDGPDGVEVVHGVDPADVVATLAEMAADRGPAG